MHVWAVAAVTSTDHGMDLLLDLAVIMCVAATTTVVFQRIRQPVVLGYLLAGMIVGPHLPIPLFADETVAHQFSELGVVLLMFSLGLEFSLRKLARVATTAGLVAVIQCSLMVSLGYATGRLFGWTSVESLFAGALIAISSTTIIVKAFAEQGVTGKLAEIVFGILIVEDLIAILLLALLTPLAAGTQPSPGALALTVGKLAVFLAALLAIGMLVVPRLVRLVTRGGRTETIVVANVGICFAFALLARSFGYSVALGAFIAGALVSESGEGSKIEHLLQPVRDMFAAVFFVSVGMLIDPVLVAQHWGAVLAFTAVVVVGKLFGVALGAFLAGHSVRTSVQAGMSLAQIGEFSFIIAGVGLAFGAVRPFLYPIAVAVSAITTLTTPWLIRASGGVAAIIDRRLPAPLQTFASLYGTWVEQLRTAPPPRTTRARIRRLIWLLVLDAAVLATLVIAASLNLTRLVALGARFAPLPPQMLRSLVLGAVAVLAVPFILGSIRIARALGVTLTALAFPAATRHHGQGDPLDLALAPRKALLVTIQIGILLAAGLPFAALTQPFVPRFPMVAALLAVAMALVWPFWRSAANLHGHVRAGAQLVLEALSAPAVHPSESAERHVELQRLLPGLGQATLVRLRPDAPAVGRSLKELNLRGLTGATVIAIERGPNDVIHPTGDERLAAHEVIVLTGAGDAVAAAEALLLGPPQQTQRPCAT